MCSHAFVSSVPKWCLYSSWIMLSSLQRYYYLLLFFGLFIVSLYNWQNKPDVFYWMFTKLNTMRDVAFFHYPSCTDSIKPCLHFHLILQILKLPMDHLFPDIDVFMWYIDLTVGLIVGTFVGQATSKGRSLLYPPMKLLAVIFVNTYILTCNDNRQIIEMRIKCSFTDQLVSSILWDKISEKNNQSWLD
jgi:hypothetical protein